MPASYCDLPEDLILQLNPAEVRRYAIAQGWQRAEGVNGVIALYRHPASDLDQLIVPLDRSMEGTIRARATLAANDYQIAWQAHGAARYVALSGMLIRERRMHRIERISQFKLVAT
jgi:hypothetical protein